MRRRGGRTEFTPGGRQTTLARMRAGQSGIVVQLQGGYGLVNRLSALGIIPGKRIIKVSSTLMRGPQTIEVDRTRIAIGFGMASRILVQLDESTI